MQVDRSAVSIGASVVASIGASLCCVVPLVLVTAGLGGAWLSALHGFAPYRPVFVLIALAALGLAYWQLFPRTDPQCEPDQACADPGVQRRRKAVFWTVAIAVAALLAFPYYVPLFT